MFRAFVAVLPPKKGEKIVTQKRPPGHHGQTGTPSFFEIKKQNYVYYQFSGMMLMLAISCSIFGNSAQKYML